MLKSTLKGSARRFALVGALVALMAAASASAASANVIVTPNEGVEQTGATVTVSGTTVPAGTTDVAIVLCNAEAATGTRCDLLSSTPGFVTQAAFTGGVKIAVRRGAWTDYDFTKGTPPTKLGTSTTCLSESEGGEACEIVVSYYETTEKGPKQLGSAAAPILFE